MKKITKIWIAVGSVAAVGAVVGTVLPLTVFAKEESANPELSDATKMNIDKLQGILDKQKAYMEQQKEAIDGVVKLVPYPTSSSGDLDKILAQIETLKAQIAEKQAQLKAESADVISVGHEKEFMGDKIAKLNADSAKDQTAAATLTTTINQKQREAQSASAAATRAQTERANLQTRLDTIKAQIVALQVKIDAAKAAPAQP